MYLIISKLLNVPRGKYPWGIIVQQVSVDSACLIFVCFDIQSILMLCEKVKMGEYEGALDNYRKFTFSEEAVQEKTV